MIVDSRECVVGSHNWTNSAFVRNREVSVWSQDSQLAAQLEAMFLGIPGFAELGAAP